MARRGRVHGDGGSWRRALGGRCVRVRTCVGAAASCQGINLAQALLHLHAAAGAATRASTCPQGSAGAVSLSCASHIPSRARAWRWSCRPPGPPAGPTGGVRVCMGGVVGVWGCHALPAPSRRLPAAALPLQSATKIAKNCCPCQVHERQVNQNACRLLAAGDKVPHPHWWASFLLACGVPGHNLDTRLSVVHSGAVGWGAPLIAYCCSSSLPPASPSPLHPRPPHPSGPEGLDSIDRVCSILEHRLQRPLTNTTTALHIHVGGGMAWGGVGSNGEQRGAAAGVCVGGQQLLLLPPPAAL